MVTSVRCTLVVSLREFCLQAITLTVSGFGIGQTPVVGPVYIAEIAPASIRGLCTCIFTGMVYLGM